MEKYKNDDLIDDNGFYTDLTPEDYYLMKDIDYSFRIIVYSTLSKYLSLPFIVEVDPKNSFSNKTFYSLYGCPEIGNNYITEWPKHWAWKLWNVPK